MQMLAQARAIGSILVWSILLMALMAGLVMLVARLRKGMRADDTAAETDGFTLADLRRLHASGKLNQEQFDRARALLVERAHERERTRPETEPQSKPDVRR